MTALLVDRRGAGSDLAAERESTALGTVQDNHWTSWTATGASGEGALNKVPTKVTLSAR